MVVRVSDEYAEGIGQLTPPDNWEYPVDRFVTALDLAERGASDEQVRHVFQEVDE